MWIFRRDIDMILYDNSDNNTTTDWTTANNSSIIINIIINVFLYISCFRDEGTLSYRACLIFGEVDLRNSSLYIIRQ